MRKRFLRIVVVLARDSGHAEYRQVSFKFEDTESSIGLSLLAFQPRFRSDDYVGFMPFRTGVKLFFFFFISKEGATARLAHRIQTQFGALALSHAAAAFWFSSAMRLTGNRENGSSGLGKGIEADFRRGKALDVQLKEKLACKAEGLAGRWKLGGSAEFARSRQLVSAPGGAGSQRRLPENCRRHCRAFNRGQGPGRAPAPHVHEGTTEPPRSRWPPNFRSTSRPRQRQ